MYALLGRQKLNAKLRQNKVAFDAKEVDAYLDSLELTQIRKKPVVRKQDFYKVTAAPHSYQVDVVFLPSYKSSNKGITSFLLAVDVGSRKAFAHPLKSTKLSSIIDAYEEFLKDCQLDAITITAEDQFNNAQFKAYNDTLGIMVRTGKKKAAVEKLAKTVRAVRKERIVPAGAAIAAIKRPASGRQLTAAASIGRKASSPGAANTGGAEQVLQNLRA
ncbi:hypothetical protein WJX72_006436 [[Myrmecia] bisecta]|uniref:Uncharacterized protein n=1 Tax=[Myrmecia] bisecta TaxID=41462 RepID=A0AAW1P3X5_9CHLO